MPRCLSPSAPSRNHERPSPGERKRPEDVVARRSRTERRVNQKNAVDTNAAERSRAGCARAQGRGDRRGAAPVPRPRQREVRGERPCVARKSTALERAGDRLRERDERPASRSAADPDDLRRPPRRKTPDTLQLEVEARRARGRRASRGTDVLRAVFGKLVEEAERQVALRGGHPPELALGKADATRRERSVERRVLNGDGEEGADLRPLLLFVCLLVGLGEEPRLCAGLAAERRVSRADRAVPAEVLETVRALLDERALGHLLASLAKDVRRRVVVVLAPAHAGIIGENGR